MNKFIYNQPRCEVIDFCAEENLCIIVASAGTGESLTPGTGEW